MVYQIYYINIIFQMLESKLIIVNNLVFVRHL